MRKILLMHLFLASVVSTASAADLGELDNPSKPFTWTGVYLGGSIGWAKTKDDDPTLPPLGLSERSEGDNDNLGVHAGVNYQAGQFVFGGEYEYKDLDIQFINQTGFPLGIFIENSHALKARMGVAVDRLHAYGLLGGFHAKLNNGLEDWSYLAGAGLEVAITDNIVMGVEYSHAWYDTFDTLHIKGSLDQYSFRLGYKF